jgi:hypothetical protein
MKRVVESRSPRARPSPSQTEDESQSFWRDVRNVIVPAQRWYYAFHGIVIVVALAYWIASRIFLPDASWAEIALYRPHGDNQVWPVITALSHFNFGDPTDALKHGQGIGGFHAVILLPHALAYKVFGIPGYMVADVFFSWFYFVAAAVLFRRWGLSRRSSLLLSAAVATGSFQSILQKLSVAFAKFLGLFNQSLSEWSFPDFINLAIASKRIPRPLPTEILLLLILYFFTRQWFQPREASWKRGLGVGVLMGILAQGDPYSFSALGLLGLFVLARTMWLQHWKVPWRFVLGALGGVALVGWYFVIQIVGQNPDSAVRFGLANYSRSKIHLLPSYGPWLRLLVAAGGVLLVRALVLRRTRSLAAVEKTPRGSAGAGGTNSHSHPDLNAHTWFAFFAMAMVLSAWAAQPVQLFLLGKGAQIYHFYIFTLPTFFAYALLLLLIRVFKLLNLTDANEPSIWPPRVTAVLCGMAVAFMFLLGNEMATDVIRHRGTSRADITPWSSVGDAFRPSLRALDKEYRENPQLKNSRTVGTFCQEVNYLLTAFHEKRAYLPDNGFSTLSDKELEERLFEMAKLCQLRPDQFADMIQDTYTMNFWLGCAKYWCAPDHKFSDDRDYAPANLEALHQMSPQTAFNLVLPHSEFDRLVTAYHAAWNRPSDLRTYPETVILSSLLRQQGISIDKSLYHEIYTNTVFAVYMKTAHD